MQVVIELSKDDWTLLKYGSKKIGLDYIFEKHSIELPEHHGRLIDADLVKNTLDIYVINKYNGQFIRRSDIDTIPTVIERSGRK